MFVCLNQPQTYEWLRVSIAYQFRVLNFHIRLPHLKLINCVIYKNSHNS